LPKRPQLGCADVATLWTRLPAFASASLLDGLEAVEAWALCPEPWVRREPATALTNPDPPRVDTAEAIAAFNPGTARSAPAVVPGIRNATARKAVTRIV